MFGIGAVVPRLAYFSFGKAAVNDDQFDLHYVDILAGDNTYHVDFDA